MDAVQHFEIPYKVRERAKKFYFQAFGWQIFDVAGSAYSFATTVPVEKNGMPKRVGAINGGLTPRNKQLTAPTLLIKVGDLSTHLERVRHAGGTIVTEPTPMGPVWYARFRDSEGNVLGAIQDRPEGQEPGRAVKKTPAKATKKGKSSKGKAGGSSKAGRSKPAKRAAAVKPKAATKKTRTPRKPAKREPNPVWSR